MDIMIRSKVEIPLKEFLELHHFLVEEVSPNILKVHKDKLDVYIKLDPNHLFFEVDLGDVSEYRSVELYQDLLDLNTEILPVSLGLDTTTDRKQRLIIVESRETENLDENEILSVFDSIYIAYVKVGKKLESYIK